VAASIADSSGVIIFRMPDPTVEQHFSGRADHVRTIYDTIVKASSALGPVEQDPKKTSIHLNRRVAFAGVQTRKDALILTLKSDRDIKHRRVHKTEQTSANRWHFEVRLTAPEEVDDQIRKWIEASYELAQ
jgi:predicted DNA-binding protein (MmcQ/YjbR family)